MLNQTASYAAGQPLQQSETECVRGAFAATEDLLVRVVHVVNRIAGAPKGAADAAVPCPPMPDGVLPSLRARADELSSFGAYVSTELDRLEKML